VRIDSLLAGTQGFTKNGAGQLVLTSASSTISGPITVTNGVLQLNGASLTSATSVAINGGSLVSATTSANAIGGTISFGGGLLQFNSNPGTDYSSQVSTDRWCLS
jgi:autotransporter-associated beta strand protein